ncbi:MAG: invasin domain 3-containing protein, partial [Candidatus Zixiibacteriota bacterium]
MTVSFSQTELAAIPGSTATVEVTVTDVEGKPVTDEIVTLTLSPQVGSLSEVKNQGNGTYTAIYTAGVELGEVKITASTTNGKEGSDSVMLIEGLPKEIKLTIEPLELIAGSGKTANITVNVYDVAKHPLKGKNVSLSLSPKIGVLSSVTDKGDGTYTATYTAGETPGVVTLTAKVEDITQEGKITLKEPGEPSLSQSKVVVTSPIEAGQTATITVTLRDIDDNPVPNRKVRISIEGVDEPMETDPTDAQGQTKATTKTFTQIGSYSITVYVLPNGPTFEKKELNVRPAPPDKIEIVAPEKAETETEVVLTMSVYDRYGNPISDAIVKMKTDLGTVTSPADSTGEGKYTATFSSGGDEGTAMITASIEGGLSKSAPVVVYKYPRIKVGDIESDNPINPLWGKAGTTFTITAEANISGTMTFSIGDIPGIQNHPMQEVSTGNYEGAYTVPTGAKIDVADVPVTLRLEDAFGNLAESTLQEHVAIDNVPPPPPEDLRVEGGGISRENVSDVIVYASATPEREVILTVTDISDGKKIGDFPSVAGNDGKVTWTLDTKNWTNEELKEYRFEAAEEPDAVGNDGEIARLTVIRDIRPNTVVLFVRLSPSEISYNADASFEVTIGFTENPPESAEVNITLSPLTGAERTFILPLRPDEPDSLKFKADVLGYWEYQISWPGNADHRPAERTGSFEVGPGEAELSLEKKIDNVKPGQEIRFSGQLMLSDQLTEDELKNQPIKMQAQKPDVGAWEQIKGESLTDSKGYFEARFTPDKDGVWQFRAVWDGLKDKGGRQLYQASVSPIVEVTVLFPSGKVVIAVGGNSSESYWKRTFLKLGRHVYDVFSRRGFPAENIRFLSPAPTEAPTDTLISKDALKDAIDWGAKDLGPNENLYLYMLSDNLKDSGFILQSGVHGVERLDKSDVHEWLKEISARKVNLVLVLESCYSGEYIQNAPVKTTDARRVFITSADARTQADIIRTDS